MAQYVYSMMGVGKVVPPKKHILKDISLSFFPGAKIGVLGLNGAGKSTLLRIMAGIDTEIEGEAIPQKNLKVGYLPQEPQLDDDSDVRANVEQGLGEAKTLLDEFERVSTRFGEELTDDEMNALIEEQGELQTKIDAIGAWEIERKLEIAADALRLPHLRVAEHAKGSGVIRADLGCEHCRREELARASHPLGTLHRLVVGD